MTFEQFFKAYAFYYGENDANWMKVLMIQLLDNGMGSLELISDYIQETNLHMAESTGLAKLQEYRSIRDRLIYVLEDWIRYRDKNENIFKIFGISHDF